MATRFSLAASLLLIGVLHAGDWPQFRGPHRNAVSSDVGLLKSWPEGGPAKLWSVATCGVGYAGPAVVGDRLFLSGGRDGKDLLLALDVADGKEIWATPIGPLFQWKGNQWNAGPNATPTVVVADGKPAAILALGGRGDLLCAEPTGAPRWRRNLPRDFGGEVNPIGGGLEDPTPLGWGYSGPPLVEGNRVVVQVGGKRGLLLALDLATGEPVWQSSEVVDQASYSAPIVADLAGARTVVQMTNAGAVGVDLATGKRLWSYRREPAYADVVIPTPLVSGDMVYLTSGFGEGCDLLRVSKTDAGGAAELKYQSKAMVNRDGGVVLHDGHVYGHSENKGWTCQELATGKVVWAEKRKLGRGPVSLADGKLYCVDDTEGDVALVAASPTGWAEAGRFSLPAKSAKRLQSGGVWTHPVVAHGRLYLRDQELLFTYAVK